MEAKIKEIINKYKNIDWAKFNRFSDTVKDYVAYSKVVEKHRIELGFSDIDKALFGIRPGEVVYIVSPTSVGKTAIGMNIATHNSLNANGLILYFSLENTKYQLYERQLQLIEGKSTWQVEGEHTRANEDYIEEKEKALQKYDNIINVIYRIKLFELIPYIKACEELFKKEISLVIIDYAQLIVHSGSRYEKISDIAESIKEVSLHLELPIVVLSQVGRGKELEKDGLNIYSAKGSGEIENSAQIYLTLEQIKEAKTGEIDNSVIKDFEDKKIDLLKLKVHKKKRGEFAESVVIMNRTSLKMLEYHKKPLVEFEQEPV